MHAKIVGLVATTALAATLMAPGAAKAVSVGLELSILADVSGSVDATEFALQRDAYADAFKSMAVKDAIAANPTGSIAVNFVWWSGPGSQSEALPWQVVTAANADAFGDLIAGLGRPFGGTTAPQSAIDFVITGGGGDPFDNGFDSPRQIIDISTDGVSNNDPGNTAGAVGSAAGCLTGGNIANCTTFGRDNAIAAGVDAINAIVIDPSPSGPSLALVQEYAEGALLAGDNLPLFVADDFNDFSSIIVQKLEREISDAPVPASLTLLGIGLLALGRGVRGRAKS